MRRSSVGYETSVHGSDVDCSNAFFLQGATLAGEPNSSHRYENSTATNMTPDNDNHRSVISEIDMDMADGHYSHHKWDKGSLSEFHEKAPKGGDKKRLKLPASAEVVRLSSIRSIAVLLSGIAVLSVVVAAVAAVAVSERFNTQSVDSFITVAVSSSFVDKPARQINFIVKDIRFLFETLQMAPNMGNRSLPTVEERLIKSSGLFDASLTIPRGNHSIDLAVPNTGGIVGISTWRQHYREKIITIVKRGYEIPKVTLQFTDGTTIVCDSNFIIKDALFATPGGERIGRQGAYAGGYTDTPRFRTEVSSLSSRDPNPANQPPPDNRRSQWYTSIPDDDRIISQYTVAYATQPRFIYDKKPRLVISFLGNMRNDQTFLGKANMEIDLSVLWDRVRSTYRFPGCEVMLLSGDKVLASTTTPPGQGEFDDVIVSDSSSLSPAESSIGCSILFYEGEYHKMCPRTIATLGYQPLLDVYNSPDPSVRQLLTAEKRIVGIPEIYGGLVEQSSGVEVQTIMSGGQKYYIASNRNVGSRSTYNTSWVAVAMVPEILLHDGKKSVRSHVILITAAIVVTIGFLIVFSVRVLLAPVTTIAVAMQRKDYLRSPVTDEQHPKFSWFAEVRVIQEEYGRMMDVLLKLRTYIPHHLRETELSQRSTNPLTKRCCAKESFVNVNGEGTPGTHLSWNDWNSSRSLADGYDRDTTEVLDVEEHDETGFADIRNTGPKERECGDAAPSKGAGRSTHGYAADDAVSPRPIFFGDSCLVDRIVSVVHVNVINFHYYARTVHPKVISTDFANFLSLMNTEVERFGGVLEDFAGDKVLVSFNATSKCDHHSIAAAYFSYRVTSATNLGIPERAQRNHTENRLSASPQPEARRLGINCGAAKGRAYVGPLGNTNLSRHTIISNAVSEAVALERHGRMHAGWNALIAGDMIAAIEGYCKYVFVDTRFLPGSDGKRRSVACLRGPMLSPAADPSIVQRWLVRRDLLCLSSDVGGESPYPSPTFSYDPDMRHFPSATHPLPTIDFADEFSMRSVLAALPILPSVNPYVSLNDAWRAFLEGNIERWRESLKLAMDETSLIEEAQADDEYSAIVEDMTVFMTSESDGRRYVSSIGSEFWLYRFDRKKNFSDVRGSDGRDT